MKLITIIDRNWKKTEWYFGSSLDKRIVEMLEIPGHPFFVGTQGHPELKSRPNLAHIRCSRTDPGNSSVSPVRRKM